MYYFCLVLIANWYFAHEAAQLGRVYTVLMLVNLFQRLFHRRYHQHQRFAFFSPFNCCCDIEKNEYDLNKIVVTWYSLENIVVVNMEDIDAECHYLVRNVWETLYWKTSVLPFAQVAASVLALSSLTIDDTHKTKLNILRNLQYTIHNTKKTEIDIIHNTKIRK